MSKNVGNPRSGFPFSPFHPKRWFSLLCLYTCCMSTPHSCFRCLPGQTQHGGCSGEKLPTAGLDAEGWKNTAAKPWECKCIQVVLCCWSKFYFGVKCSSYRHSKWRVTRGGCVCLGNSRQQERKRGGRESASFPRSRQHFFFGFSFTNCQQMRLAKRQGLWRHLKPF